MSTFIVSEKTLYKVMRAIEVASKNMFNVKLKDELQKNPKKVFYMLNNLNQSAYNYRYNEGFKEPSYIYNANDYYKSRASNCFNKIDLFKSLQCFIYQCSEGTVVKKKLFKTIDIISNCLASYIISELPEYEKAAWGS
tara:strand:- start:79 stop:492 length:414 start_codon:yes stop_codon:yes gene_type:complete